jgi:hypothetical protein
MFIKDSVFKKFLKEAYAGLGLRVAQTDDGIYTISGGYWSLEVAKRDIDRNILGELVKFTGEMPEKGEGMEYRKCEAPQQMMVDTIWQGLVHLYADATDDDRYEPGKLLLMTEGTPAIVFQNTNGIAHVLMANKVMPLIQWEKKGDDGEPVGNPMLCGSQLIWSDFVSSFACLVRPIRYVGENCVMKALEGTDLCWKNISEEMI